MKRKSDFIRHKDLKPGFEFVHLQLARYRVVKWHKVADTVDVENVETGKVVKGIPYKLIKEHGKAVKER